MDVGGKTQDPIFVIDKLTSKYVCVYHMLVQCNSSICHDNDTRLRRDS
jgi:hypothetical protein